MKPYRLLLPLGFAVLLAACSLLGPPVPPPPPAEVSGLRQEPPSRMVDVCIALSGFTALGAEVVWTRLLSLHVGATTYTFSLSLAVLLLGLGTMTP